MFHFFSKKKKVRNSILGVTIGSLFALQFFAALLAPTPVRAITGAPDATAAINIQSIQQGTRYLQDKTENRIEDVLLSSLLGSLVQGFSFFMRKIAYDTATYIASGGWGQTPHVFDQGFGAYLETTALDAVATSVEELGQPFGLNLCSPPNINFQVYLQVGLRGLYSGTSGPKPSCQWNNFVDNWSNVQDAINPFGGPGEPKSAEEFFSRSIRASRQTDFGVAAGALASIDRINANAREANVLDRLEGQGFKSVTELISGNIKTPAQILKEETNSITANGQTDLTATQIAGIYGSSALQVFPVAGSVFLNTLVSEGLNTLLTDGLLSRRGAGSSISADDFSGGPFNANRQAAERAFSFLLTTIPARYSDIDIVAAFHACPTATRPGLNNCVIDDGLFQALTRDKQGQATLTIMEAMQQGLMHAEWPLIPPSRVADNGDIRNCKDGKYCYSNIQKLRKVRILPLGFEIAARRSDPDQPWTLGQVVSNYENCNRNPDGSVNYDPDYPFCHLIDPNWVIKAPVEQCEANVFGPELLAENTTDRRSECVDISTCVSFDENGTCEQYGYCTREKNVWDFPGESCDEQFASCKTYVNEESGQIASYLSRTLDVGSCDVDSVGCRAYSAERDANGEWISSDRTIIDEQDNDAGDGFIEFLSLQAFRLAGRNPVLYLNGSITGQTCPAGAQGCHAFVQLAENEEGVFEEIQTVNLKKAPDYLGCYDIDPSTYTIEYPTQKAELALIEGDSAACAPFASACVASEVGCDGHLPLDGSSISVPGIVGANACDQTCVGYDAYTQVASAFEAEVDPLYFIPSAAEQCASQYVGCSEFTNLDDIAAGGEGLEYYTDIKYCEKPEGPNRDNEKTFYTWEGSETSGYVIRVHKLKLVDQADATILTSILAGQGFDLVSDLSALGSPAYNDLTTDALVSNYEQCNAASYQALINGGENPADPDCREFFDDEGNTYYRLLAETVTVSDACSPLRASNTNVELDTTIASEGICSAAGGLWQDGQCQRCLGGGRYDNGSCIYNAISTESQSCPAAANECRAYAGNFTNNVYPVATFTFEPFGGDADALATAKEGWNAGSVVSEALQVGGYSLQLNVQNAGLVLDAGTIKSDVASNLTYELSFWARGGSQNVQVLFVQNDAVVGRFTPDQNPISVGNEWREYTVGPATFTGNPDAETELRFVRSSNSGNTAYYIDNVRLTRVENAQSLIKNSWKTADGYDAPLACDSNPIDIFPGEFLGCEAYEAESTGDTVFATGFEQLCRPEAIGCQPFMDTFNTVEDEAVGYNLWCEGAPGTCTLSFEFNGNQVAESCQIEVGQEGCLVPKMVFPAGTPMDQIVNKPFVILSSAAVILPADTDSQDPIYLAARPEFQCDGSRYLGCTEVALEEQLFSNDASNAYSFVETYVVNNPANYGQTLCSNSEVGCSSYSSDAGISYFKDPTITGQKICTYREDDGSGIAGNSGWFLDDIGECLLDGTPTGDLCSVASDCSDEGATCENVNNVACYPDFIEDNLSYGLPSNSSDAYRGFVGSCPASANLCTEFVDPLDTSAQYPAGQPYYVINDATLTNRIGECQGQASQREGCVLFNVTENPAKIYNAEATYEKSEAAATANGGLNTPQASLVDPVTTGNLNANIILRVDRDRQCSQWLACKNEVTYRDENGEPVRLCYDYDLCESADGERCDYFVEGAETYSESFLSDTQYVERDTSWYGRDYSGYSLYNHFPVADYVYTALPGVESDTTYLAHVVTNDQLFNPVAEGCVDGAGNLKDDWNVCGIDGGGRCISGSCLYPIDGTFPEEYSGESFASNPESIIFETNSCKAFPEASSPFPQSVLSGSTISITSDIQDGKVFTRELFPNKKAAYVNANVCQDGACSCAYQKISFQDGTTDYWPATGVDVPTAICSGGGSRDGAPCVADPGNPNGPGINNECVDQSNVENVGICRTARQIEKRLGTYGYCLERDLSRPINGGTEFACLTWLPLEISASRYDVYNQVREAGYYPTLEYDAPQGGGQVMCTQSTARGAGAYDPDGFRNITSLPISTPDSPSVTPFETVANIGDYVVDTIHISGNTSAQSWYHPKFKELFDLNSNSVGYGYPLGIGSASNNWSCQQSGSVDTIIGSSVHNTNLPDTYQQDYLDYACFSGSTVTENRDFTTLLYLWGWRVLASVDSSNDTNVTLLRADYAVGTSGVDSFGWWNHDAGGQAACDEGDECSVYSLFPLSKRDTGTLLHPPRVFASESQPLKRMRTFSNEMTIFTDLHSATKSNDVANVNNRLFVSDIQESLNEADIEKVYVVPTAYPGGRDDMVPAIFSRQVAIDIEQLRSQLEVNPDGAAKLKDSGIIVDDGNNTFASNKRKSVDDRFIYSYALQRTDDAAKCFGLLSYCEYDSADDNYDYIGGSAIDENSEIHRRYVVVYGKDNASYLQINKQGPPLGYQNDDPFTADCEGVDGVDNTYFAVGLDFNKDGEFLGYISRMCTQDPGGDQVQGMMTAIYASLKDRCIGFATVYDESGEISPSKTTNKAWTNNVWRYATTQLNFLEGGLAYDGKSSPVFTGTSYPVSQFARPFGSLRDLTAADVDKNAGLKDYAFTDPSVGAPLACIRTDASSYLSPANIFSVLYGCNALRAAGYNTQIAYHLAGGHGTDDEAFAAMTSQMFALAFEWKNYRGLNFSSYEDLRNPKVVSEYANIADRDRSESVGTQLRPPQIYALNPATCDNAFALSNAGCTGAESNAFSINSVNSREGDYDRDGKVDEDLNGNAISDDRKLLGVGSYFAVARFFAFADHNRMPIKRVLIDWQDKSEILDEVSATGQFKNRKPFCAVEPDASDVGQCGGTTITCRQDSDCSGVEGAPGCVLPEDGEPGFFGNAARACEAGYFEYTHTYTCTEGDWLNNGSQSAADIENADLRSFLAQEKGFSDLTQLDVCIYRPRVQVQDNWGFCNASFLAPTPYGSIWAPITEGLQDQVGVTQAGKFNCDPNSVDVNNMPWTYFAGEIVVIKE